jgi:hypothetical protein
MGMTMQAGERRKRVGLMLGLCAVCLAVLFFLRPVALSADYHDFADKRRLLNIPNCLDVLSNLPFLAVGIGSLAWLARKASRKAFLLPEERWPYIVFFAGVTLTGFGSLWYHLAPSDARLPWDLLPMTCSFVSMLVAVIMERISVKAGLTLLLPMLILGIGSVVWWYVSGDYRFYLFVQFCPPLLIATTIGLFPARYTGNVYLVIAFLFFVLAKLFEMFDRQIYSFTGMVSGHSLKHATAGVACYWIVLMLARREPVLAYHRNNASVEPHEEFA